MIVFEHNHTLMLAFVITEARTGRLRRELELSRKPSEGCSIGALVPDALLVPEVSVGHFEPSGGGSWGYNARMVFANKMGSKSGIIYFFKKVHFRSNLQMTSFERSYTSALANFDIEVSKLRYRG